MRPYKKSAPLNAEALFNQHTDILNQFFEDVNSPTEEEAWALFDWSCGNYKRGRKKSREIQRWAEDILMVTIQPAPRKKEYFCRYCGKYMVGHPDMIRDNAIICYGCAGELWYA